MTAFRLALPHTADQRHHWARKAKLSDPWCITDDRNGQVVANRCSECVGATMDGLDLLRIGSALG
ncbi:hypothetical protein AB0I53_29765 [Saccharopolyspora sp. NPDC050389]|uniref:hypothetical protein n=1 Tax=Saccharopolyspora sp. NPDC050389 TaxID=3155516 RepID=UPI0033DEC7EA